MRRAVKPLAICLLCLAAPILFISLGVFLINLKPSKEDDIGFRVEDGYIQYTEDGEYWKSIIAVSELIGATGNDGRELVIQASSTHIQWKYEDEDVWRDLIPLASLKGLQGTAGKSAYEIAVEQGFDGDVDAWLASLNGKTGPTGPQGPKGDNGSIWHSGTNYNDITANVGDFFYDEDDCNIYKKTESGWVFVANIKGETGVAKEIEVAVNSGNIQWRYMTGNDTEWKTLVSLSDLKGNDGTTPTIGIINGKWVVNGVEIGSAVGTNGNDGKTPYIQGGYWYIDGVNQGVKAEGVTGATGDAGDDGKSAYELYRENNPESTLSEEEWIESLKGADGKKIVLQNNGTHVQWQYEGDTGWTDLIEIESLKGLQGEDGKSAYDIAKEKDPTLDTVDKWLASLKGEKGDRGTMWYTGTDVVTAPTDAREGDLYYNTATGDIYQKTEEGWGEPISNIKGQAGSAGSQGPQGTPGADANLVEYTITYIYGDAESYFDDTTKHHEDDYTETIAATQWITTLPQVKEEYREDFIGWFIVCTDRQVKNYDFIGGNVQLAARFHSMGMSGLYQNDIIVASWTELLLTGKMSVNEGTIVDCNDSLYGDLIIDESVTAIGETAFEGCEGLTKVVIPSTVTHIYESAFKNCKNITDISFDENSQLERLQDFAFEGCESLKQMNIIGSVRLVIGRGILSGCSQVETITLKGGGSHYFDADSCNYIYEYGPDYDTYVVAGCKSSVIRGGNLVGIYSYAFHNNTGLTDIYIPAPPPDWVYPFSIGDYAFYGCTNLTTVTIDAPTVANNLVTAESEGYILSNATTVYIKENLNISSSTYLTSNYVEVETNDGYTKYVKAGLYDENGVMTASWDELTGVGGIIKVEDNVIIDCTATDSASDLVISNDITAIGEEAFLECFGFANIIIPNSVTTIMDRAFSFCISLTNITIPESVTSIATSAFENCTRLESIDVKSGNTVYDSREDCNAIIETSSNILTLGCKNTTIPDSVVGIGDHAFNNCVDLTNITIPASVTSIGERSFYSCISLTSITIPASVTEIGDNAFYLCSNLTEVIFENPNGWKAGNTELSAADLSDPSIAATYLTSTYREELWTRTEIAIEDLDPGLYDENGVMTASWDELTAEGGMITVADNKMTSCDKSIAGCLVMPDGITSLCSFSGCTNLTGIVISEGVKSIAAEDFYNCTSLTTIVIPASVTTIRNYLEENNLSRHCPNLKYAIFKNPYGWNKKHIPDSALDDDFDYEEEISPEILTDPQQAANILRSYSGYYDYLQRIEQPAVTTEAGLYDENGVMTASWDELTAEGGMIAVTDNVITSCDKSIAGELVIAEGITAIGDYFSRVFEGCTGLTGVIIPEGVESIGTCAFRGCTGLTGVAIPSSVTRIDACSFEDCTSLASLTFKEGSQLTHIDRNAFENCASLTELVIPEGVQSIDSYAFADCTGLTSIVIPSTVRELGWTYEDESAFSNCPNITSIVIDEGNTSYYSGNNNDAIITLEGHPRYTADTLILGCSTTVIPNSVKRIHEYAFYNCTGLTEINIPVDVTHIGGYAFAGCTGLTEINIPADVTHIGGYAFAGCTGLTSISIPASVTQIYSGAFARCSGLTSIVVDDGNQYYNSANNCNAIIEISTRELIAGCVNTVIPSDIYRIEIGAFADCVGLTEITIPASVNYIERDAFSGCSNLVSVTFETGSQLQEIGLCAFSGCTALTEITIPDGVIYVGNGSFSGCSNLTSVIFENDEGWYVYMEEGEDWEWQNFLDVSDPETAAEQLTETYCDKEWFKGE